MARTLPSLLLTKIVTRAVDAAGLTWMYVVRPPVVGWVKDIASIAISSLLPKVSAPWFGADRSFTWRGEASTGRIAKVGDLHFRADGDPEFEFTRKYDANVAKFGGCDCLQCLIDPGITTERSNGHFVDSIWTTQMASFCYGRYQDVNYGSLVSPGKDRKSTRL